MILLWIRIQRVFSDIQGGIGAGISIHNEYRDTLPDGIQDEPVRDIRRHDFDRFHGVYNWNGNEAKGEKRKIF
jgi:hypothetical protein